MHFIISSGIAEEACSRKQVPYMRITAERHTKIQPVVHPHLIHGERIKCSRRRQHSLGCAQAFPASSILHPRVSILSLSDSLIHTAQQPRHPNKGCNAQYRPAPLHTTTSSPREGPGTILCNGPLEYVQSKQIRRPSYPFAQGIFLLHKKLLQAETCTSIQNVSSGTALCIQETPRHSRAPYDAVNRRTSCILLCNTLLILVRTLLSRLVDD